MVEVVVEVVVLWEAPEIAVLHFVEVREFGSTDRWHEIIKLYGKRGV